MKVKMKIKWSKFSLFCISALLLTSAHCKSTDVLAPKAATQKTNLEQAVDAKKTKQEATKQSVKAPPQTREEKIKAMVEANDNQAKKLQADMENRHLKKRILKKNCGMAKNQLQDLMTTARVKVKTDKGSTRYLTQTEKAEKMRETRQAIKRYCGHD